MQTDGSIMEQVEHVCESRAEPRSTPCIGRVVDPTTLFISESGGLALSFVLFFAGAASATSGDGLVPDELDEEAERAEPGCVGKPRYSGTVQ